MQSPSPALLLQELERRGILVGRSFVRPRLAALTGFVGDFVGVGRVASPMESPRFARAQRTGSD